MRKTNAYSKSQGYYRNGRHYSSKAAFLRQMRRYYAGLPPYQKKHFKAISLDSERPTKHRPIVEGNHFSDVRTGIQKRTILKSVEDKRTGTYHLKTSHETYRVNNANYNDPEAGTFGVIEVEEASRYTPADLQYEYVELGPGSSQVNAIKDKRIVKSTITTQLPLEASETSKLTLQQRFLVWDQTKDSDDRLSSAELKLLGKDLGLQTGGGRLRKYQVTMENRIRKKLEEQKIQSRQLNITRNFPQSTKITTRSKGKKYDNQDEINLILATEMAHLI